MQTGKIFLATLVAAVLAGCAAPARVNEMQVDTSMAARVAISNSQLRENVAIRDVTGGKDTNPMWVSNVSSSDFESALEKSLRAAGLLSANRQAGKYMLVADMQKLDQPLFGASMTVTATVRYALIERASNKEVWGRTLATPYTAEWNAAFLGTERLKLANEGAVRTNLSQLIDALVGFKVAGGDVQLVK